MGEEGGEHLKQKKQHMQRPQDWASEKATEPGKWWAEGRVAEDIDGEVGTDFLPTLKTQFEYHFLCELSQATTP